MNPTLTLDLDGVRYSVTFDRWDALQSERARWQWTIGETPIGNAPTAAPLAAGDDLTTVTRGALNMGEALATLLTFLSAACEAIDYEGRTGRTAENADLFPRSLFDTLDLDADYLAMTATELTGERS